MKRDLDLFTYAIDMYKTENPVVDLSGEVNVFDASDKSSIIRYIDLFAGLGGTRLGFAQACLEKNFQPECVFTSEIKEFAVSVYKDNFQDADIHGDITQIGPSHKFRQLIPLKLGCKRLQTALD